MINILSYIGMSLQSEVCLWTVIGILRTIFDATLFQVNANLKQIWHMNMPEELSLPLQRVLRTTISGVILVECFTVYIYLASYIVLLYPVFLEERPTLVLPWLLLAAVRNFLCQLTSLALGLGTCVLLGPARPPCVKFVISKLVSIMPAFYMWMLVFSYYHYLKLASAFKTFPAVMPPKGFDYGLELAVRRRRTKSLQGEDQLRKKLIASFYGEQATNIATVVSQRSAKLSEINTDSSKSSNEDIKAGLDTLCPLSVTSNRTISDIGTYEDWFGSEVVVPRDTDRILEQFVIMLLRIGVFIKNDITDPIKLFSNSQAFLPQRSKIECPAISTEEPETPPQVGNKGKMASYLRDYPQIFMKKPSDVFGSINPPENRPQNNNTQNDIDYSSQSSESTKDISLDTVSLAHVNNEILPFHNKPSKTLIHSHEELTRYIDKNEKQIENIDPQELEHRKYNLELKESIESVINRMKIRVIGNEMSKEDKKDCVNYINSSKKFNRQTERVLSPGHSRKNKQSNTESRYNKNK